jgi:Ca-activated chloride channel family protein
MVSNPVLAKVQIPAEGVTLGSITPDPHPDVFAARPLVVTGIWTGEPKGKIIVRGIGGNGAPFEKSIDLAEAAAASGLDHPALPVLWADSATPCSRLTRRFSPSMKRRVISRAWRRR